MECEPLITPERAPTPESVATATWNEYAVNATNALTMQVTEVIGTGVEGHRHGLGVTLAGLICTDDEKITTSGFAPYTLR